MLRPLTASSPSFIQEVLSFSSAAKFLSSFPSFAENRAKHPADQVESPKLCLSLLHRHLNNNKIIQQVHSRLLTNGCLLYQETNGRPLMFNALLRCYSLGQTPLQAFLLYKQHKSPCFDSFTYSFLLKASASLLYPELSDQVHGLTLKLGLGSHVYVMTALVDMYVVVGKLVEARKVFDEMPERNPVSWNVLITGMINWGELQTAISLFEEMPVRTVVSWTGVIDGHTRMNKFDEAKALFRRMVASDEIRPNEITILAIFPAVSNKGELRMCKSIHGYTEKLGFFDIRVTNALIDAYAKCGCINSASRFFEEISEKRKNLVSWTSIVSAFAMHGMGKEAVDSFETMEKTGLKPNQVTFLSLLNACSHGGLVEEGLKFFEMMVNDYNIAPEIKHYGCLADMLGRFSKMRGTRLIGSRLSILGNLAESHSKSAYMKPILIANMIDLPSASTPLEIKLPRVFSVMFSSSTSETLHESATCRPIGTSCDKDENDLDGDEDRNDDSEDVDDDDVLSVGKSSLASDERLLEDFTTIMDLLKQCGNNHVEIRYKLDQCSVKPSPDLVSEVLSRVRNDWETAFTFFVWAGNHLGYSHTIREYHSMISILGKMRKFDTAWSVIDEMRKASPSLVTQQTLLIMIRKYCAVRDVGRAINTFYAYKKFKFDLGMDEFHSFLSALCRYKNVQDAEHLLFCNRETYPFNTKSFNIILNGWCNLIGSPREAERVWWEMGKRNIKCDVMSYSSIMSCYSKSGNLHKVLRLFDQMKKSRIEPDRKVYNAVVHALAKARFVAQAMNLMKTMEEKGIDPSIVTYNSLIKPLCKARKIDEAKKVFDEMLNRRIFPTIRTYHAFIRILKTGEDIFYLLEKMRKSGCEPNIDTYVMLIRKFCRWRDFDSVFRLWNELKENGVGPDRSSYIVMIHGLFLNGKVEEAYKYYLEMKEKDMVVEPNLEEMIQSWVSGKRIAEEKMKDLEGNEPGSLRGMSQGKRVVSRKFSGEGDFLRQPQNRRVVREGGFSFWDD